MQRMACSGEHRRAGAATCRRHRAGRRWRVGRRRGRRSTGWPSPRMAQPKRQHRSYGVRVADEADAGPSVRGAPGALPCRTNVCRSVNSTAVPVYDAFCSAPVRCGKSACPSSLPASLRDGPRDCQRARVLLDHVHAHGLERRVLRGGGVLGSGGMRAEAVRFARRAVHTLFAPTAGVNVSRVPQVPVWTCGGYLGIRCAKV